MPEKEKPREHKLTSHTLKDESLERLEKNSNFNSPEIGLPETVRVVHAEERNGNDG